MSLIAILVDVQTNKLLNSTSRWNHIILPKSGAADTMFESWKQLNDAVGIDVESICRDECKQLKAGIEKKIENANFEVERILKSVDVVDKYTIPEPLKTLITSIEIPGNVKVVGNEAFYHCTGLISVTIPDSVTSIGAFAFQGCSGLTSMMIPDSVTRIGDGAFYNCIRLTSVTIGNSVTSIGNYAFYNCIRLTSVTIGNSVTSIGNYAFYYCTSLTSVTIPDSVKSIGDWAFNGCRRLTSVTIPDSIKNIRYKAFCQCINLKNIVFEGKTLEEVKSMEYYPWGIEDTSIINV